MGIRKSKIWINVDDVKMEESIFPSQNGFFYVMASGGLYSLILHHNSQSLIISSIYRQSPVKSPDIKTLLVTLILNKIDWSKTSQMRTVD